MKKLLTILGILMLLAIITRAVEPPVGIPAEQVTLVGYGQEFSVDGFAGAATTDFNKGDWFGGFGINYFFNSRFGIGGHTTFYDDRGQFFDNVAIKGIYRFPIEETAPYVFAGAMRHFEEHEYGIVLGLGLEHRFSKWFAGFAEVSMEKFVDIDPLAVGKVGIRIPLSLTK